MAKNKKKKLMILIWNMGIGGIQKRLRDILLDISQNKPDWQVYLLIKLKEPSHLVTEISTQTKVKIIYFTDSYEESKTLPAVFWMAKHYLKIKPDVCLAFLDHLSIIMVTLKHLLFWQKTKLILNEGIYTSRYLQIYRKRTNLWRFLVKITYPHANKIIVPTQICKTDLVKNFGVSTHKIEIIPNWTLFKPTTPLKPAYDMIFIGRFEKEKRLLTLVSLIEKLKRDYPHICLYLVGKGKQENLLKKTIKRRQLEKNIEMPGYQINVVPFLRKAKIFVLPSENEGMSNVVLEAAMCQLPTVANHFEGAEKVIQHGKTGYLTSSPEKMLKFIKKLLKNPTLREKLGYQAQIWVSQNFGQKNQERFIATLLD